MQEKDIRYKVFFITGGGTGGHIYPAVSIANELKAKGALNIYYIGNKNNAEYEIVKSLGIEFLNVPVKGMPRKIDINCISFLFNLLKSVLLSLFYIIKYGPSVVFATGGYVSAPMVIASNIFKIPYVMHESDAYPGVVTRKFSKNANCVNLAFDEAKKYLNTDKITNYGNPVRREFFDTKKEDARKLLNINDDEFTILIMGGSQGAKTINNAAIGIADYFKDKKGVKIIHQTGKKNYESVYNEIIALCGKIPDNLILKPYFDCMEIPVSASDIVISRAGSLSISEIQARKLPCILIPYPYAACDHQRVNAKCVEKTGAAIYIEDSEFSAEKALEILVDLLKNKEKMETLKNAASNYKKDNPSDKITELVINAISNKKAGKIENECP